MEQHFPELAQGIQVNEMLENLPMPIRLCIDPERRAIKFKSMLILNSEYGADALLQPDHQWIEQESLEKILNTMITVYITGGEDRCATRSLAHTYLFCMSPENSHRLLSIYRGVNALKSTLFGGSALQRMQTEIRAHAKNLEAQHIMVDVCTTIAEYLAEAEAEVSSSVGEMVAASRHRIEALRLNIRYASAVDRACARLDTEMFGMLYPKIAEREQESLQLPRKEGVW